MASLPLPFSLTIRCRPTVPPAPDRLKTSTPAVRHHQPQPGDRPAVAAALVRGRTATARRQYRHGGGHAQESPGQRFHRGFSFVSSMSGAMMVALRRLPGLRCDYNGG
jgi:hypothetical protein